jgi:hypothetical protein
LLKLSILKEAGLIDNGSTTTNSNAATRVRPFVARNSRLEKDVKCSFGILKCRWRILKTGNWLEGMEVTNNIWKTCCALQNWLLEIDGVDGEWEGAIGQHDANDVVQHMPFSMCWLQSGPDPRLYNASRMGPGEDYDDLTATMETINDIEVIEEDDDDDVPIRIIQYLSLSYFRNKLIQLGLNTEQL